MPTVHCLNLMHRVIFNNLCPLLPLRLLWSDPQFTDLLSDGGHVSVHLCLYIPLYVWVFFIMSFISLSLLSLFLSHLIFSHLFILFFTHSCVFLVCFPENLPNFQKAIIPPNPKNCQKSEFFQWIVSDESSRKQFLWGFGWINSTERTSQLRS